MTSYSRFVSDGHNLLSVLLWNQQLLHCVSAVSLLCSVKETLFNMILQPTCLCIFCRLFLIGYFLTMCQGRVFYCFCHSSSVILRSSSMQCYFQLPFCLFVPLGLCSGYGHSCLRVSALLQQSISSHVILWLPFFLWTVWWSIAWKVSYDDIINGPL